ncbi:sugar phosphate isomerase/epimerase family protein [Streptomyces sp. NPDC056149]|uniref:sugar phosphate isomerase/epimerase family protein n=1 Tax=Streptomyces sp. NPDC056149 TaxID=3345728 RepID=UPI0035DDCE46
MSDPRRVMWNGTVRSLSLADQLLAAQTAGCEALAITPSDYNRWLGSGISTREMRGMAADAGVGLSHLDPLVRWVAAWEPHLPGGEEFPVETVAFDEDDFFRMAAALGVESFTAWAGFPPGRYSREQLVDAFGGLCRRAAVEGLRCDLEFIPVFGIPDLRSAWDVVRGADAANSGIVFDLWHYMRGGRDDALLETIPGERITGVQLCDADAKVPEGMSLAYDGLNNRKAPGEGDFPVSEIVDVLRAIGGLNSVGLEVFSPAFDAMSAEEVGVRTRAALDAVLAP